VTKKLIHLFEPSLAGCNEKISRENNLPQVKSTINITEVERGRFKREPFKAVKIFQ